MYYPLLLSNNFTNSAVFFYELPTSCASTCLELGTPAGDFLFRNRTSCVPRGRKTAVVSARLEHDDLTTPCDVRDRSQNCNTSQAETKRSQIATCSEHQWYRTSQDGRPSSPAQLARRDLLAERPSLGHRRHGHLEVVSSRKATYEAVRPSVQRRRGGEILNSESGETNVG